MEVNGYSKLYLLLKLIMKFLPKTNIIYKFNREEIEQNA